MNCKSSTVAVVLVLAMSILAWSEISIASDDSLKERRARLSKMSSLEKDKLQQQHERFSRLPDDEQRRLRQLDKAIATDPQSTRLRQIMQSYSEWLRALPSNERVELMSLPVEKRIERVKQLLAEQEQERFKELFGSKLQPSDQKILLEWVHGLIKRDEERILKQLTPMERQRLQRIEDITQRRVMMAMIFRWKSAEAGLFELLQPSEEDLKGLAAKLSPLARDTLAAARNEREREQLIQNWARAVMDTRVRPPISKDEMQRFLEQTISEEQRAYLESLPRDRMRFELQRLYMRYRFGNSPRPGNSYPNALPGRRGGIKRGNGQERSRTQD